jgi:hypothetical protein
MFPLHMCFITFQMIYHMDNEGMTTFPRPCGHPAAQAVSSVTTSLDHALLPGDVAILQLRQSVQSPASHCTGLDSILGQSMWMLWGTKFHCNIFLSKYFVFPVSITPPLLHSHSCIYHQCNITLAQHNFLVNTVVGQT